MDNVYGLYEKALALCEERSQLLGSNLANASTPHYKAKDINFQGMLNDMSHQETSAAELIGAEPGHLTGESAASANVMYRVPMQTSMDGNTVDQEIERKNFMQNAVRYEVNLTFIQNKTKELIEAIKGE